MDVVEQDNAYIVMAEIPGVAKDDIQVSIEGNQVTIGAEVKRELDAKDGAARAAQRAACGSVYRGFTLPIGDRRDGQQCEVRERRARADAGKKAAAAGRRLTVQ